MGDSTEPPPVPLRLVLQFGERVEVDGSTVYDPAAQRPTPAVLLRLPAHRAAWIGRTLDRYTRMCRLAGADVAAGERGPAWALARAASAAGHVEPATVQLRRVTSARRAAAGAALRAAQDVDDITMIAVVDAAARWLDEPDGDEYAWALLGAVTDGPTQQRAYAELLGVPTQPPPAPTRDGDAAGGSRDGRTGAGSGGEDDPGPARRSTSGADPLRTPVSADLPHAGRPPETSDGW